jgi:hypothetical protein
MTTPADLRTTEAHPSDLITKLRDIAARRRLLEEEEDRILAELAGAAPGAGATVTPSVNNVHERIEPDMPSPKGLIPLKCAAHQWEMTDRRFKPFADRHGALHKIGGRWMIDAVKLTAAVFG